MNVKRLRLSSPLEKLSSAIVDNCTKAGFSSSVVAAKESLTFENTSPLKILQPTYETKEVQTCLSTKAIECGIVTYAKSINDFALNCFHCDESYPIWEWPEFSAHIRKNHAFIEFSYKYNDAFGTINLQNMQIEKSKINEEIEMMDIKEEYIDEDDDNLVDVSEFLDDTTPTVKPYETTPVINPIETKPAKKPNEPALISVKSTNAEEISTTKVRPKIKITVPIPKLFTKNHGKILEKKSLTPKKVTTVANTCSLTIKGSPDNRPEIFALNDVINIVKLQEKRFSHTMHKVILDFLDAVKQYPILKSSWYINASSYKKPICEIASILNEKWDLKITALNLFAIWNGMKKWYNYNLNCDLCSKKERLKYILYFQKFTEILRGAKVTFFCGLCASNFETSKDIFEHYLSCTGLTIVCEKVNYKTKFFCKFCNRKFKTGEAAMLHMTFNHRCHYCEEFIPVENHLCLYIKKGLCTRRCKNLTYN